jgi:hypothetical protein
MDDFTCVVYIPQGLNIARLQHVVGWTWQMSFLSLVFMDVCGIMLLAESQSPEVVAAA